MRPEKTLVRSWNHNKATSSRRLERRKVFRTKNVIGRRQGTSTKRFQSWNRLVLAYNNICTRSCAGAVHTKLDLIRKITRPPEQVEIFATFPRSDENFSRYNRNFFPSSFFNAEYAEGRKALNSECSALKNDVKVIVLRFLTPFFVSGVRRG